MRQWRHQIHRHPETAYTEVKTAELVASTLRSLGLEVHTGLAETGVVGVLRRGDSSASVALRADMDALHLQERNRFAHRSTVDGKMHACGHDGHTAMLLGAAVLLAAQEDLSGTVYFIFQPAEENEGGAQRMIEEGLFDTFDTPQVFGMHNMPGLDTGRFAIRTGPMMAAFSTFECTVRGRGGHSAMPELVIDPIKLGTELVKQWSKALDQPIGFDHRSTTVVTQFRAGSTWNVIPDTAVLKGSARSFSEADTERIEKTLRSIASDICGAADAKFELHVERCYPPLVNEQNATQLAADTAAQLVGNDSVNRELEPIQGSEDFAYMLREKPGAYILIGNGTEGAGGCMVHDPNYDFNDDILDLGARYWRQLALNALAQQR
jgi:hippurate hydrolase